MTPEALGEIVAKRDISALVNALAPLDEKQRKRLWPAVQKLESAARKSLSIERDHVAWCVFRLAMVACSPRKQVVEMDWSRELATVSDNDAAILTAYGHILADRRPSWLDQVVDGGLPWEALLVLVESGCIPDLACDGVVRSLVYLFSRPEVPLGSRLLSHKQFLEAVYRLFEIDTGLFYYWGSDVLLANSAWPQAIIDLCNQGHLDRTRLLAKITESLSYDVNKLSLKGLVLFHDQLARDDSYRKLLENEYLALLGASDTAIVGFSVAQLKAIGKAKLLDCDAYVRELPHVFQCTARSHPKAALALLKSVVKQQPKLRGAATLAAAEGLSHAHEDVQDAAIKLVDDWAEPGDFQLGEILAAHRDHAAAPVQLRVDAILKKLAAGNSTEAVSATESSSAAANQEDLFEAELAERRTRIDKLPTPLRKNHGFDAILAAGESGMLTAPTIWRLLDAPLRTSLEPLEPIRSLDELFDAVAHGIERLDHGDEVERILDGISRLCDQRPNDFDRRAAPLIHRITRLLKSESPTLALLTHYTQRATATLLFAWLTDADLPKDEGFLSSAWYNFMARRIRELLPQVQKRLAAPLLAAPTHRGGWIDPVVWLDRFGALVSSHVTVNRFDLLQSFLRLTPDGRLDALANLPREQLPYHDAIVWALGGEPQGSPSDQPPDVWIAASRCRDSDICLTGDPWPDEPLDGPDVLQPAEYHWRSTRGARQIWGSFVHESEQGSEPMISIQRRPRMVALDAGKYPTALSHRHEPGFDPTWVIQWSAMLWPGKLTGYWACAVEALLRRINMKPSALEPHAAYLDPLFEPDRPLCELSAIALWVASVSKDTDSRTAAMDAWVEVIRDGRGDVKLLSNVLVRISHGDWLQLNRLAELLREVSRNSPLHAWSAAEILQDLLQSMDKLPRPRDTHHILQLLRELLIELGLEVRADLKPSLKAIQGASKTAKLARDLAQLTASEQLPQRRAGLLQLVDARLERAERWADAKCE